MIVEDALGDDKFAEEDGLTREEQLALAEYQIVDGADDHEDEADDLYDTDTEDAPGVPESMPEPHEQTPTIETPPVETPTQSVHDDQPAGVMVVAAHGATAAGPEPVDPYSGSVPLKQPRRARDLGDFDLALGIFCIDNSISRQQYTSLKQILELLKEGDGIAQIGRLPDTVDTLKRHTREELPHLDIRSKEVMLNPKKLSSSRRQTALIAGKDPEKPSQDLFFMDPINLWGRVLSSKLTEKMHFGMALLVDNPTEAWHSLQWAGMIRSTSGEFVFYPPGADGPPTSKEPILPGDTIAFNCASQTCSKCLNGDHHVGQVLGVYRDNRECRLLGEVGADMSPNHPTDTIGHNEPVLLVARVADGKRLVQRIRRNKLPCRNPLTTQDLHPGEQILMIDPGELVDAKKAIKRVELQFDYGFESSASFVDDPASSANRIRRAFHTRQQTFLPMCKVTPVPGVLEVNQFSRQELIDKFVRSDKVVSMPIYTFIDGFGLYRTMRKSVMGVYMQPVALPRSEHTRLANVYVLTLGPHASNFEDVTKALAPMRFIEAGVVVPINGVDTMVCTPMLALIGDLVQQNQNSGCLSVAANLFCRRCVAPTVERGNLEYDIYLNKRAHFEIPVSVSPSTVSRQSPASSSYPRSTAFLLSVLPQ